MSNEPVTTCPKCQGKNMVGSGEEKQCFDCLRKRYPQLKLRDVDAGLRAHLAARRGGANTYDVRMRVTGYVVYRVQADTSDQAETKAWDMFDDGESPHEDNTECNEAVKVVEVVPK